MCLPIFYPVIVGAHPMAVNCLASLTQPVSQSSVPATTMGSAAIGSASTVQGEEGMYPSVIKNAPDLLQT